MYSKEQLQRKLKFVELHDIPSLVNLINQCLAEMERAEAAEHRAAVLEEALEIMAVERLNGSCPLFDAPEAEGNREF